MKKIIAKNVVNRRDGYLYYIDDNGNVVETIMARAQRQGQAGEPATTPPTTVTPTVNEGTMIPLSSTEDKIIDTQKVTAGYFTGGGGQVNAADIYTMSLADANENYYFNIAQTHPESASAATQFSVTYGHVAGSGSDTSSDTEIGETQAIYGQFASLLLAESEVTGGFQIETAGTRDDDIYVLSTKRSLMKDRINKKNWTIILSGSDSAGAGAAKLTLTDDSNDIAAVSTVAGPRYNIVSGSDGSVVVAASTKTYGWIYPEVGTLVFSATQLSSSIPGASASNGVATFDSDNYKGFGPVTLVDDDYKNGLRFVNCLRPSGAYLKFRNEEDQTSVSYFCRAKASQMNFSNNPTFVSGSQNQIKLKSFWGNPNVYITGVGLYNNTGQMIAIGKLSTPIKKNFSSEATIKVKLTY